MASDRRTVEEIDIGELVALEDGSGGKYRPLPDEEISGDARNLISMMEPMLSSTVGPMGENLHMFCFPSTDENGRRIADPAAVGSMTVRVGEETYRWDLPLGSVLQALKCPVDDEPMKGNWKYCPFHGKKLVVRN